MRIDIRLGQGGGPAAADLHRWLCQDPRVRRHAELRLGSSRPDTATMGTFDVVELVVGQGVAALNLALSYAAWRGTRPAAPPTPAVTFTVHDVSIRVEGECDEATVRRIAELLDRAAREPA
ncbi:effector-associated constant component EACC1 [Streptomyces sp. JW3]|uniref:effector-associated constant component EACC1 n=1 Tax=Streptomyces sp. JW3 TaxID=3456955 RepID=UPI003FA44D2D